MTANAIEVVESFWKLMASNNFRSVGLLLSDDFVLEWPQSGERIRGRENFAGMNEEYPVNGGWKFTLNKILGSDFKAVTIFSVKDEVQQARFFSFFTIKNGQILRMIEFWPDNYPAPENRR